VDCSSLGVWVEIVACSRVCERKMIFCGLRLRIVSLRSTKERVAIAEGELEFRESLEGKVKVANSALLQATPGWLLPVEMLVIHKFKRPLT
jgi:hypothetical protein